jgi:hypothetical protein
MSRIVRPTVRTGLLISALLTGAGLAAAADLVGVSFFDGKLWDVNPATGLVGITQHPVSGIFYVLTTYSSALGAYLYELNVATGDVTPIVPPDVTRVFEGDLDFDPTTGILYALQDWGTTADQTNLFTIDLMSGAATIIADLEPELGDDRDYSAMAFNDQGHLYVLNTDLDQIVRIDPASGEVIARVFLSIPGQPSPTLGNCAAMAFDPVTDQLYLADGCDDGNDVLYAVDLGTGVLTELGPTSLTSGLSGMWFERTPPLFSDGFESGTTDAWSSVVP